MSKNRKIVVITGASNGIGKEVALLFLSRGYYVYSLSRSAEDKRIELFADGVIEYRTCDVTNKESIASAFLNIPHIDILIHVAGYGIAGSCEMVSDEDAHRQMETNYFGVLNVNRVALPIMRKQKSGIIIITTSIAGVYPIPFQSHYSSSKFALEGYAGALRLELKSFGIKVATIQPGDTKTNFTKSRIHLEPVTSPYKEVSDRSIAKMAHDEQNGLSVKSVAKLYYKVARKKNPAPSYATAFSYKMLVFLKRFFPNRFASWVLSKMYL